MNMKRSDSRHVTARTGCYRAGGNRNVHRQTAKNADVRGRPETDQQRQPHCAKNRQKGIRHYFGHQGGSGRGICGKDTELGGWNGPFFDELNEKK